MTFEELLKSTKINELYPKPDEFKSKHVSYGTAGFRTKASDLDWVMYRMGMLACLRSICLECKTIGCMITASHNPAEDNGCKLIDPLGEMLEEKWEAYASLLVNSNHLQQTLIELSQSDELKPRIEWLNKQGAHHRPKIIAAHDTRPSGVQLLEAFRTGASILGADFVNNGVLSTPQLHYMVRCLNTGNSYGAPTENGYFEKLATAFFNVWSTIDFGEKSNYEMELYVDGANGVGAEKIKVLAELFSKKQLDLVDENRNQQAKQPKLKINLFNDAVDQPDRLNHLCGADYVKVQQKPPLNLPQPNNESIRKYCSLDGDADRVVYYFLKPDPTDPKFHLLDGDKISTLIATHLKVLLTSAHLDERVNLCIVQTAYANGSSTNFIENEMKVKVSCVPTGVKYLHHEAQKFDIGVYFEANGHGTILFSEKAEETIEREYRELIGEGAPSELLSNNQRAKSIYQLKHLKDCINQTVGDALSDMLVVELCLAARGSSVADWSQMYTDLPSRQLKVRVADRNRIQTTDAERRVREPIELQTRIDETVGAGERAFVRPSGTEDVVRVYAESSTQEKADLLANRISQLVFDLAGGVGPRP